MEKLLTEIELNTTETASITGIKQINQRVLLAIKSTDRKPFVPLKNQNLAYKNVAIELGLEQTISQPFIVALMIHLIEPHQNDKVLEVGSGSGYVAAVLSKLCHQVFGIEIREILAEQSKKTLSLLHITNVHILSGNGHDGLLAYAPFDKIIISAAAHKAPDLLLEQLSIGGLLTFPKNISSREQVLVCIKKMSSCEYIMHDILPVRFVPLVNDLPSL